MIVSFLFTYLCFNEGKLYQKNVCDAHDDEKHLTINDVLDLGYELVPHGDRYFSLRKNNEYLSARPDMDMTHSPQSLGWEKFRIVDSKKLLKVIPLPTKKEISKKIHQTDSSDGIRDIFLNNVETLKKKNPEYTYNFYSSKDRIDFIYENFGWSVLNLYLSINSRYGAARADLFRYLCIYKNGGVYLDMKSGTNTPFSDIINPDDRILLSHWDSEKSTNFHGWGRGAEISHLPKGEFIQWFIIATAGNELLRKVINQVLANIYLYNEEIHGYGRDATFMVTGPFAFTRAISGHVATGNHRIIDAEMSGIVYNNVPNYKRLTHYSGSQLPLVL